MIGIITRTARTVSRPFSRTPWVSWYCKLSDKSHYHWSALTVIVQKYKLVNLCWFSSYLHTTWDRRYVTDTSKWIIFYWNVVIVEFYAVVLFVTTFSEETIPPVVRPPPSEHWLRLGFRTDDRRITASEHLCGLFVYVFQWNECLTK